MLITAELTILGCILLFMMVLVATLTMPFSALVKNFPEDVQYSLQPRLKALPMSPKRVVGGILVIVLVIAWASIFIIGGLNGRTEGFGYKEHLIRLLVIGLGVKAFDILCLDYILLTKTKFFQYFFPETEGCRGWKQFGYNRKQQIRQTIVVIISCFIGAWIFTKA
jgi:hypothetical protein